MRFFDYRDGALYAEDVPLAVIAEAVGTPVYVYSRATLEHHYKVFKAALGDLKVHICYAVKANTNRAVIATLAALGAGADTVSEGEIRRALHAGVPADGIVFAGVGKTDAELAYAISVGVRQINIESASELARISRLASAQGKVQKVCIRVNPDVGAGGHAKITTGKADNKFGVSFDLAEALYAEANELTGVEPVGLSVHIGSQIIDFTPMEQAYRKLVACVGRLRARGLTVTRLDLGGGLAATYDETVSGPDLVAYGAMVRNVVGDLDIELEFEPGRMIAANAGVLLTRAIVTKDNGGKAFLVVDAAMNDLIRPALYEAYHQMLPVRQAVDHDNLAPLDVVGPVCETGDTFAEQRPMPAIGEGDLIAFMSTGAYGFAMASTYNSRPLAAEVMVSGDQWQVVRPRQTYEEMFGMETLPDWLGPQAEKA
ncbi:diaminopimelate decarboxylase [Candidatus Phycosocius bacilliformis]|uniref:Diaminopimelate decarboxylase n=1 Tax=Candidatus Phycosocius bacilliformis TaxID=1445552 RepID=A0A2P2E9E4_9PROT|nr:diaminopimelate decarboxylase [Candidatus Phycosocius bacilliformis]GBF57673.1 diaminopimelate decarboxylase [Candidatus Phycosocius bacilliformis]